MDPGVLASMIEGAADEVLIDRLNYAGKVAGLLRSSGLAPLMSMPRVRAAARELQDILTEKGIPVSILFT